MVRKQQLTISQSHQNFQEPWQNLASWVLRWILEKDSEQACMQTPSNLCQLAVQLISWHHFQAVLNKSALCYHICRHHWFFYNNYCKFQNAYYIFSISIFTALTSAYGCYINIYEFFFKYKQRNPLFCTSNITHLTITYYQPSVYCVLMA